jgi:hypothetical protein
MAAFDENSYNTSSFSILSYDFGAAIVEGWRQTKRFSLRAMTQIRVALGAR